MRLFLLVLLISWVVGICLGVWGVQWVLAVVIAVGMGVWVWKMRMKNPYLGAVMGLVMLGFVYGGWSVTCLLSVDCDVEQIRSGEVSEHPAIKQDRQQLVVRNGECGVYVTVSRYYELNKGDEIKLIGGDYQDLSEVADYSPGFAEYLARNGLSGTVRWTEIEVVDDKHSLIADWRRSLAGQVVKLWPESAASVIQAMVMAERGTIPEEITGQFRAAGVSHVLAISGLHISLLVGMLVGVVYLLPISPWPRTLFVLALLWLYVLFIGVPASALRAATFWTLFVLALRFKMLVSLPTVVVLTVAILMSFDPGLAGEVGWQLSVSAVLGIFGALFVTGRLGREWNGFWQWLWSLVVVSLGAGLSTAPLVAYHFGNVSLIGVVANVLVVPVVPMVLVLAIISLVLSLFIMPLALMAAWTVNVLIDWMAGVTRWLASIPGVFYEEVSMPLWGVGLYYLLLVLVLILMAKWRRRNWREIWG